MTTKIEWSDETWNPVTGCTKTSIGCKHCYAERIANGIKHQGSSDKYRRGFLVTTHPKELDEPLRWRKPRRVFVCSMGDLFHEEVAPTFIEKVFDVMRRAHGHTFVVLTKRAERMAKRPYPWPDNVWAGVTIEANRYMYRLDYLRRIPSRVRFVSFEPLLTEIPKPDLTGIHWAIVGGERASREPRKMQEQWVYDLKSECKRQGVAFFFKQWGDAYGFLGPEVRQIDGKKHEEIPLEIGGQASLF